MHQPAVSQSYILGISVKSSTSDTVHISHYLNNGDIKIVILSIISAKTL